VFTPCINQPLVIQYDLHLVVLSLQWSNAANHNLSISFIKSTICGVHDTVGSIVTSHTPILSTVGLEAIN